MKNKREVTEFDLRRPEFQDPKITPDMFEFDATGEVVRKDRFEKSMRKIYGMLCGINGLSSREAWTCDQVVGAVEKLLRFKQLITAIEKMPEGAEFYHFENKEYIRGIDQEHLQIARNEPKEPHLVNNHVFLNGTWDFSSTWLEYIDVLVSIDDIKKEIADMVADNAT